jgi:hypothetical protein
MSPLLSPTKTLQDKDYVVHRKPQKITICNLN